MVLIMHLIGFLKITSFVWRAACCRRFFPQQKTRCLKNDMFFKFVGTTANNVLKNNMFLKVGGYNGECFSEKIHFLKVCGYNGELFSEK